MAGTRRLDEQIPFADLCSVFNAVSGTRGGANKKKLLLKFINAWRQQRTRLSDCAQETFYPILRLLLPNMDRGREAYGLKEKTLALRLIEALSIDKKSEDAIRLVQFSHPTTSHRPGGSADTGDFASVASAIIAARVNGKGGATIADINRCLDKIAEATDSQPSREQTLWFCKTLKEIELKWFLRIVLKSLKIGLSTEAIFTLYHPDASRLYDVSVSLEHVCEALPALGVSIQSVSLTPMRPFRPMLASFVTPEKITDIMGGREFYVETKYDGERVQLHRQGDKYAYFSRRGFELTSSYGDSSDNGTLTPRIHHAFDESVNNCILDGEMIGWSSDRKCFVTKSDHVSLKHLKEEQLVQPLYVVFDCLLLNDTIMTEMPLRERVKKLRQILRPVDERLIIVDQKIISSSEEIIEKLAEAIGNHDEGLMIKSPESTYRFNVRSYEAGWLKLKPDYLHSLCDQLDLLIVGGYFGTGKRANLLSHFLLAVVDENTLHKERPTFLSVCKVSSGYTMDELYKLNVKLIQTHLMRACPPWLRLGKEKAQVYVDFTTSAVLQVRSSEIVKSRSFAVGDTLRFGRVDMIRHDKGWQDVTTLDEFRRLKELDNECKMERLSNAVGQERSSNSGRKRPMITALLNIGQSKRLHSIQPVADVFEGKEFCILTVDKKEQLEEEVVKLGGSIVQNPSKRTFCTVADRNTLKVQSIARASISDIVKVDWLIGCVEKNSLLPWTPEDMLHVTEKTKRAMAESFDPFGDSYTIPIVDKEKLRQLCSRMRIEQLASLPDVVKKLRKKLLKSPRNVGQ